MQHCRCERKKRERSSATGSNTISSLMIQKLGLPLKYLQYHPRIEHYGYEENGNDHKRKTPLIVRQILLVSISGKV